MRHPRSPRGAQRLPQPSRATGRFLTARRSVHLSAEELTAYPTDASALRLPHIIGQRLFAFWHADVHSSRSGFLRLKQDAGRLLVWLLVIHWRATACSIFDKRCAAPIRRSGGLSIPISSVSYWSYLLYPVLRPAISPRILIMCHCPSALNDVAGMLVKSVSQWAA
ncbi:hypothetical protein BC834DRAFT_861427 [Gloeopeniophorella convolvens]|nr:hypothetical protein BC834DRAFT_861427 [Gloeopeniophorella convolvens]